MHLITQHIGFRLALLRLVTDLALKALDLPRPRAQVVLELLDLLEEDRVLRLLTGLLPFVHLLNACPNGRDFVIALLELAALRLQSRLGLPHSSAAAEKKSDRRAQRRGRNQQGDEQKLRHDGYHRDHPGRPLLAVMTEEKTCSAGFLTEYGKWMGMVTMSVSHGHRDAAAGRGLATSAIGSTRNLLRRTESPLIERDPDQAGKNEP